MPIGEWMPVGPLAFGAGLTGAGITADNDVGIWRDLGFGPDLIAREGDAVAGLTDIYLGGPFAPVLNEFGRAAFTSTLTGTGVDFTNDRALFGEWW